jgi:hypothetical protein
VLLLWINENQVPQTRGKEEKFSKLTLFSALLLYFSGET